MIECHDDGALISRRADGWAVPLVRYNLKDRIVPTQCECGRDRAMRVLGRAGDTVSLRSAIFHADEVLDTVRGVPGVTDAQIVLSAASSEAETSAGSMTIDFTTDGADHAIAAVSDAVRDRLLAGFVHMASIVTKYSDALHIEHVANLTRIERTNRTPEIVRR
jgi:phenylacetate-CoA ligase